MQKAVLYIHGKGGNSAESEHYKKFFPDSFVIGLDYKSFLPYENETEFISAYEELNRQFEKITIIANSIGAFFTMNALQKKNISVAFFISPIVDMEKIIFDMMTWAKVTEAELKQKQEIETDFGEKLSWKYLEYVRNNPVDWKVKTHILYGDKDNLTSLETVQKFVDNHNADLTVMKGGEHWFHTEEQILFLDNWLKSFLK